MAWELHDHSRGYASSKLSEDKNAKDPRLFTRIRMTYAVGPTMTELHKVN